ncbi:MAG: nucleoside hydrolase [Cellvibrionales bacterium TMED148]|nr:nucleoside hydrolase [Porticoccaceae bacterium]RPG88538.1 MAG: nucleoside hydrolase [Cellvibrionales bacterium TMED148]
MKNKVRILLDTDANNEIDDQHAIAYLLLSGDAFLLEGLTVNRTNNGGDIEAQALEAERVVGLCNMQPALNVTRGASGSFDEIVPHLDKSRFDGSDAVNLIIRRAEAYLGQKLVLLAIGKLTNVALALKMRPDIIDKVKLVWLGSNYPNSGEYNLEADPESLNFVLDCAVEFELAVVRYGARSGTSAVRVTLEDVATKLPGQGPAARSPITGRHGGSFIHFGDYSINLLSNVDLYYDPPSRALYDMAATAILKNPEWAEARTIPAPTLENGIWRERPENSRKIVIRENFNQKMIVDDFYRTICNYQLAEIVQD